MIIKLLLEIFSKKPWSKSEALLRLALSKYQAGQLDHCLQTLCDYLNSVTIKGMKKSVPNNFQECLAIHEMLFDLDFGDFEEGSKERVLFLLVFLYLIENSPYDVQKKLNENLEKVLAAEPSNGEPYFGLADVQKICGVSEEKARRILERVGGGKE